MNYTNQIKQFGKYIQIRGNQSWRLLDKAIVEHKIVDVVNCTSYGPNDGPLIFNKTEDVYFRGCNGNMIFFNLNSRIFPRIKNIYLDTNFEPEVYSRFGDDVNIFITENVVEHRPHYERYQCYRHFLDDQVLFNYIVVRNKKVYLMSGSDMKNNLLKSLNVKNKEMIE